MGSVMIPAIRDLLEHPGFALRYVEDPRFPGLWKRAPDPAKRSTAD